MQREELKLRYYCRLPKLPIGRVGGKQSHRSQDQQAGGAAYRGSHRRRSSGPPPPSPWPKQGDSGRGDTSLNEGGPYRREAGRGAPGGGAPQRVRTRVWARRTGTNHGDQRGVRQARAATDRW